MHQFMYFTLNYVFQPIITRCSGITGWKINSQPVSFIHNYSQIVNSQKKVTKRKSVEIIYIFLYIFNCKSKGNKPMYNILYFINYI